MRTTSTIKTTLKDAVDKINEQNDKIKQIKTEGKDPVKVLNAIRNS